MKLRSIRSKFLIAYVLLFIALITILLSVLFLYVEDLMVSKAIDESIELTNLYAENMGQIIEKHIAILQFVATDDLIKEFDRTALDYHVEKLRESEDYLFLNNAYADTEGNVYSPGHEAWVVSDRLNFEKQMAGELAYNIIGPLSGEALGHPIIGISVPIKNDDDQVVGTISGSILVEDITRMLDHVKLTNDSYAWIINHEGTFVAHPRFQFHEGITVNDLEALGYESFDEIVENLMTNPQGFGEYDDLYYKVTRIVTFDSIPYSPNWKMGISTVKSSLFLHDNRIIRISLMTTTAMLLATLLVTAFMTNSVVKPIRKLKDAVMDMKIIDASTYKHKKWYEEVYQLAIAYNTMTDKVINQKEHLEKEVKERTKELTLANEKLIEISERDKLTNAYNRGKIFREIELLREKVIQDYIHEFSIVFIDLDNFKYYNDQFGHDIGDYILIDIVNHLESTIHLRGSIGRYGGDEFILILPKFSNEMVKKLGKKIIEDISMLNGYEEKIKEKLARDDISIPDEKKLGISLGYASYNRDSQLSAEALIKQADGEMYGMKAINKNHRK